MWIDDWYRISFEGRNPVRLIQFTTDWEATYQEILFYNQLCVGCDLYPAEDLTRTDIEPLFRSFVSQNQPGIDDPGDDLILNGRWKNPIGSWVTVRPYPFGFGLGIELLADLTPATHTVIDSQGGVRTLPNHGLKH